MLKNKIGKQQQDEHFSNCRILFKFSASYDYFLIIKLIY